MRKTLRLLLWVGLLWSITSCSSVLMKIDDSKSLPVDKEFEEVVKIAKIPTPTPSPSPSPTASGTPIKAKPAKKAKVVAKKSKAKKSIKHEPSLEDAEGFEGRRPIVDPYRLGEKVVFIMSYFGATAAELTFEIPQFAEVNGRKAYVMNMSAKTLKLFEMIYKVNNTATIYMDYETLLPYSLEFTVQETKKARLGKAFFDRKELKVRYWEKKNTKDKGQEIIKEEWDMLDYSQSTYSAVFYLRSFQLTPGKTIRFRMSQDKENLVLAAEVVRKEKISTEVGTFDTVLVKPKVYKEDGTEKPIGDVSIWFTDDDRKLPVKIEGSIKIGTLRGELKSINR